MKKREPVFEEELSSIAPEEIEKNSSLFGNFCFGITAEQLEELKAGRVLFTRTNTGFSLPLWMKPRRKQSGERKNSAPPNWKPDESTSSPAILCG